MKEETFLAADARSLTFPASIDLTARWLKQGLWKVLNFQKVTEVCTGSNDYRSGMVSDGMPRRGIKIKVCKQRRAKDIEHNGPLEKSEREGSRATQNGALYTSNTVSIPWDVRENR